MPSSIESPLLANAYFPSENTAPAEPAASTSLPPARPPAASHVNRSGSQNLQRFLASLNCFDREPLNLDVTTHEGRVNYQLAVRAWAARPSRHVLEHNERKMIAERIDLWLAAGDPGATLELSGANLRSLPPLPSNLQSLNASNVFGRYGPKKYPKTWPAGLRELNIGNNNLKKLPDNLPGTLTVLGAFNCSLRRLPKLPQSLRQLDVAGNVLEALPQLPPRLVTLDVGSNKLTGIAVALPDTLTRLNLRDNPIAALPPLPANLAYLDISHTGVTGLAEGVLQAVSRAHAPMTLLAHGLTLPGLETGPAHQAHHAAVGVANQYGVCMASPSLSQAVDAWYGAPDAGRSAAWKQIYEDSQDGLANASVPLWKVLDSLKGTADYPSEVGDMPATAQARNEMRSAFRQRVTDLLGAMEKDPGLRQTCLAIAEDKVETCHDNVALGFDEMEQAHLAARASTGGFSQAALFDMGVGRLKMLLLDELAIPKANAVALAVAAETGRPPAQVLETEHGAYSGAALDALGAVSGFSGKFAALDDKVFGPARERLTRAYMELA